MFEPLGNNIFVWPEPAPEKVGEIHVAVGAIPPRQKGVVCFVGPGQYMPTGADPKLIPTGVEPGDIVLFNKYSQCEIEHEGTTYYMFNGVGALFAIVGKMPQGWVAPKDKPTDTEIYGMPTARRQILTVPNVH